MASEFFSDTKQENINGHNFANVKDSNIFIYNGISIEDHEKSLRRQKQELQDEFEVIKKQLEAASREDRNALIAEMRLKERQMEDVQKQLSNIAESYEEKIKVLKQQIKELNDLAYLFKEEVIRDAQIALAKGDESKAKELFQRVVDAAKIADNQAAKAAYELGRIAEGAINYREANQYYLEAMKRNDSTVNYLNAAARMAWKLGEYNKAIEILEKALKIGDAEQCAVATNLNLLGLVWDAKENYKKAIGYYREALKIRLRILAPEHEDIVALWINLGQAWYGENKHNRSIKINRKALKIILKNQSPDHPLAATCWNNTGMSLLRLGNPGEALVLFEKALYSDSKNFGPDHPRVAKDWNNKGAAWRLIGDYDNALDCYNEALDINLGIYHADHPQVAVNWFNMGKAWVAKNQFEEACECFERALAIYLKTYDSSHPFMHEIRDNISNAQRAKEAQKAGHLVNVSPS